MGQKKPTISLKSKKRKGVGMAGTFVVEGMHEPIIEPERWEIIQRMITSRKKCDKGDCAKYNNIFSGLVKCADCGYALIPYRSGRTQKPMRVRIMIIIVVFIARTQGIAVSTE